MNLFRNLQFENCVILEFDNHNLGIKFYYRVQVEPGNDLITSVPHKFIRMAQTIVAFTDRTNMSIIKDRYDDQSCIVRCLLSKHEVFNIGSHILNPMTFMNQMVNTHYEERLQYYATMKQQLVDGVTPGLIDFNDTSS